MNSTRSGRYLFGIAAAILMVVTLGHAEPASAVTIKVLNCNDSGTGSLRSAVFRAASGDSINLSALYCHRILLTRGQIAIPQASLALTGPGRLSLTVDGNRASRVFEHTGTGTLKITAMSIAYGRYSSSAADGGCISSYGNVQLRYARVHHCLGAVTGGALEPHADGGGIWALGNVLLYYSSVFANAVTTDYNHSGGGIYAGGQLTMYRSQLYDNMAGGAKSNGFKATYSIIQHNTGDGVDNAGYVLVNKSTLSGNIGCALCAVGIGRKTIVDSTISGNTTYRVPVLFLSAGGVAIFNSTIAFNHEAEGDMGPSQPCAGAVMAAGLRLESSIVASNTCDGAQAHDIGGFADFEPVTGSHNLIGSSVLPVPADTVSANPLLAPLAWNGGPTRTHALMVGSPAIDRGSNPLDRKYDQRGPGFPRVKGPCPDIGAFEL